MKKHYGGQPLMLDGKSWGTPMRSRPSSSPASMPLSRLRTKLRAAFGLDADPFHEFKPGMGWLARFRVGDGEEEYERALSPRAREVLERAGKLGRRSQNA
jgi:hypothetical protein